jgi:hypothetical protein
MRSTRRVATMLCLLLAAGIDAPVATAGPLFRSASAGSVCQPANGALASSFNYTMQYVTNVGSADAYLICSLIMDDHNAAPNQLQYLAVDALLANAGTTLTCTAQVGGYYNGSTHVRGSLAKSSTSVGPNASFALVFTGSTLLRDYAYDVLMLNCKVPPGGRLGLIQREEIET